MSEEKKTVHEKLKEEIDKFSSNDDCKCEQECRHNECDCEKNCSEKSQKRDCKCEESAKKYEELDERYKRLFAEFENYKKRTKKDMLNSYDNAKITLVKSLLPVMDSLNEAKEFIEKKENSCAEGFKQIYKQLELFFEINGIKEIETVGKDFNPEFHEAISIVDTKEESGKIVEEFRKGYMIGDNVIRHSLVIVSK